MPDEIFCTLVATPPEKGEGTYLYVKMREGVHIFSPQGKEQWLVLGTKQGETIFPPTSVLLAD